MRSQLFEITNEDLTKRGTKMSFRTHSLRLAAAIAIAVLALTPALFAQQLTGNVFGVTSDEQGARLPGVSCTLSGSGGAPSNTTTDSRGEFRVLNLSPGNYTLACELQGFSKLTKSDVQVAVGRNTNVAVQMKLSTVEAAVTVRGEAALLDTRKVTTGASITQVELKEIPTGRDPWVVLQSVPGVLTDRLNIGGNTSGQQSLYVGKGAMGFNNVWNLDGVNITDMSATGSTGTYYDFDSFEEINATTGGADITQVTPGVQLNLVTKRGTNDYHGSARVYLDRKQWQSHNLTPALTAQGASGGNRIDQIQDYGVEVGGPLWKDRAWLWGAYGRNQVDLFVVGGGTDKTTLEDANLKLNLQLTDSTSATGSYTQGDKLKFGRGAAPSRPPETTFNQSGVNGKPSALDKVEVSQVVSSKLFFTASYAYFRGGFGLAPVGGTAVNNVFYDNIAGVWHNSFYDYKTRRPSNFVTGTGSYFFNAGTVGNEFKFGFSYRKAGVASHTAWPGNGNYGIVGCGGPGVDCAWLTRAGAAAEQAFYYNGYVGDVMTFGNATVNAGVRYDVQYGYNQGGSAPANPTIPLILPAISGANEASQFKWKNWEPRIGVTYAAGAEKKLILKASYARFADQMGVGNVSHDNANSLAGIYYYWNDANHDHVISFGEIDFASGVLDHYGFDPAHPTLVVSPNSFDPNFKAGVTDEFLAGFDYEVLPEFVVGAAYTHRKYTGIGINQRCKTVDSTGTRCLAYLTPADFAFVKNVTGILFDGTAYSMPLYGLNGVPAPAGTGSLNRLSYDNIYDGIEFTWQKRLSNRWMVRGNFAWANWKQNSGGGAACTDPTNSLNGTFGASCPGGAAGGSDIMVAPSGTGSGAFGNVFTNAKWNFNVSGLYELPWGFNVAANFYGRQGYPFIQWVTNASCPSLTATCTGSVNPGDGLGTRSVLVTSSIGAYRHATVFDADLRLEKSITIRPLQVNLSVDVFNVANSATVLQRQGRVNAKGLTGYNSITELLSPRIVRAGARISF
jgi:hypothetical protein